MTQILEDILYAFCMYFANHIRSSLPQNTLTVISLFFMMIFLIALEECFQYFYEKKCLWRDILIECFHTCSRISSFLLVSFCISLGTTRWEEHHELMIGESIILPILLVFIGISIGKYISLSNKMKQV